jgi:hypothetical protein
LNQHGGVGNATSWSRMQRHLEYCLPAVGCYANTYPWVLLKLRFNGGYGYDGHA